MQIETAALTGASAGTRRELTACRYGVCGSGRKVYLQAGLHADEMPGVLVLQHLMTLLDAAEVRGGIVGEVLVVPAANPIGLAQWLYQRPQGRHEADGMHNFNRGYPELAKLVGDGLAGALGADEAENVALIRKSFREALAGIDPRTDLQEMQVALMNWSCDADYVLDLHCDHFAVMHLYASDARPEDTSLLCRATGARLALIENLSGGNAFDEAHTVPWFQLAERFGAKHPIPAACFSSTLEYRGQFDVDDATALRDAEGLMGFLAAIGVVTGWDKPLAQDEARYLPLGGAAEMFAPQGGVVTWDVAVGSDVAEGQVLGHVTDPVSRRRMALTAAGRRGCCFGSSFGGPACAARAWPMSRAKPLCAAGICCQTETNRVKTSKRGEWEMKTGLRTVLGLLALTAGLGLSAPVFADDTLDRGVGSEWSSLDPQVNFDAAAGWIQMDAYEGLVTYDRTGMAIPGAAESWDISADGKTYTFHLRDGLKWSNGDPLVAQEFVNGVLRTLDPATGSEKGYLLFVGHGDTGGAGADRRQTRTRRRWASRRRMTGQW